MALTRKLVWYVDGDTCFGCPMIQQEEWDSPFDPDFYCRKTGKLVAKAYAVDDYQEKKWKATKKMREAKEKNPLFVRQITNPIFDLKDPLTIPEWCPLEIVEKDDASSGND